MFKYTFVINEHVYLIHCAHIQISDKLYWSAMHEMSLLLNQQVYRSQGASSLYNFKSYNQSSETIFSELQHNLEFKSLVGHSRGQSTLVHIEIYVGEHICSPSLVCPSLGGAGGTTDVCEAPSQAIIFTGVCNIIFVIDYTMVVFPRL